MRVLIVEPQGHLPGHFSEYVRGLCKALVAKDVDVTLVTFDGLLNDAQMGINIQHVSFVENAGLCGRVARSFPKVIPSKFIQKVVSEILSTICGLGLALRIARKRNFDAIHVSSCILPEWFYPGFALLLKNRNTVFSLWNHSREEEIKGWGVKFKQALSRRQPMRCYYLTLSAVVGGKPGVLVRNQLYRWASSRNRLSFTSDSRSIIESYARAPFHDRIYHISLAVNAPGAPRVSKAEARQYLKLPQDGLILLHFGTNHTFKDFATIFEAVKGLAVDYRLLFAGKVDLQCRENAPWDLARKHHLQANTIVVDKYIPDEEVPYYFYASDAVILSHRKDFGSVSAVLYVAAQYGVPIISADAGDDGELVRKYRLGMTFNPEDSKSLQQAILMFVNLGASDRQEIKNNISHFAGEHSWQKVAEEHLKIYEPCTKDHAR